jgi:hypothetical protein
MGTRVARTPHDESSQLARARDALARSQNIQRRVDIHDGIARGEPARASARTPPRDVQGAPRCRPRQTIDIAGNECWASRQEVCPNGTRFGRLVAAGYRDGGGAEAAPFPCAIFVK